MSFCVCVCVLGFGFFGRRWCKQWCVFFHRPGRVLPNAALMSPSQPLLPICPQTIKELAASHMSTVFQGLGASSEHLTQRFCSTQSYYRQQPFHGLPLFTPLIQTQPTPPQPIPIFWWVSVLRIEMLVQKQSLWPEMGRIGLLVIANRPILRPLCEYRFMSVCRVPPPSSRVVGRERGSHL